MSPEQPNPSTLVNLVDLSVQLRRDENQTRQELHHRDRAIGRDLADWRSRPRQQLARWLARAQEPDVASMGLQVQRAHRLTLLILATAGLILGAATAGVVFYYDGSHPVNVIHALAVFVGAQLLLLALLGLTLIPRSVTRFFPGATAVQDALALLSPGRLIRFATRLMPSSVRDRIADVIGKGQSHVVLFGREQKWAVVHASQVLAVAFYAGALLRAMYLIAFSDLAFSWSTTLDLDPAHVYGVTSALARPWSGWMPEAAPSPDLIEHSRYFRLQGIEEEASANAELLGGWWPFLIACMIGYGLLPRLVLLGVSAWRFRAAMAGTMLHLPGVPALLDRLNEELVETGAERPELPSCSTAKPSVETALSSVIRDTSCVVINWAEVGLSDAAIVEWVLELTGHRPLAVYRAGGGNTLARDAEIVDAMADTNAGHSILILVKSWEPPLVEFVDFVVALRRRVGRSRPIRVLPLGMAGPDEAAPADSTHLGQWERRLRQVGDPWLTVDSPAEGRT